MPSPTLAEAGTVVGCKWPLAFVVATGPDRSGCGGCFVRRGREELRPYLRADDGGFACLSSMKDKLLFTLNN